MSKRTLTVTTPAGEFTRTTATPYTHVVVWNSPRAMAEYVASQASGAGSGSGVAARWIKDRGYGVTWHNSQRTAENAADAGYKWNGAATLVGVFAVTG